MAVSIIIYFVFDSLAIAVPDSDEMREPFTAKGLESMVGFWEIKNPFVLKGQGLSFCYGLADLVLVQLAV